MRPRSSDLTGMMIDATIFGTTFPVISWRDRLKLCLTPMQESDGEGYRIRFKVNPRGVMFIFKMDYVGQRTEAAPDAE